MIIYKGQVIDAPATHDDEGNEVTPATYLSGVYVIANYFVPELSDHITDDEPNAGAFAGIRTRYYRFESEQDWLDWVASNSDEDGVLQVTPRPPSPPRRVPRQAARQALIVKGLFGLVQPLIDDIEDATKRAIVQNYWDTSLYFYRRDPILLEMADLMDLDDEQKDDLFRLADTFKAPAD